MRSHYINYFLKKNGLETEEEIEKFLDFKEADIPDTKIMQGIDAFNKEVIAEIKANNRIVVFGDYDTDGALATTVMVRSLRLLSFQLTGNYGRISYFIPDRFIDGYGMTESTVNKLLLKNPKVNTIITVDNGIVAFDAIRLAKSKNLKVLVTDHHKSLDDGSLPDADVIVDPGRQDDAYPDKGISGTTLAYKLMLNLYESLGLPIQNMTNLLDFVGMSVVSDIMPMRGQNRYYVKKALEIFNNQNGNRLRFGWAALKEVLIRNKKLKSGKKIDEMDFGFLFSPIINAQSRVNGKANVAVDLFLSQDSVDVREKADYMVMVNEERKELSNAAFEKLNETDFSGNSIIIVQDNSLGEGLIGLLAGKLTEKYNRPSIVLTDTGNGTLKGSARSIENVDVTNALRQRDDLFIGLGGHAGAAGMSLKSSNLDELKDSMTKIFDELVPADLTAEPIPDLVINADDISLDLLEEFNSLAPFGEEFKYPLIEVDSMPIDNVKQMGADKTHLKIISDNIDIINWSGVGKFYDDAIAAGSLDVIGKAQVNDFNGKMSVQIIVSHDSLKFY